MNPNPREESRIPIVVYWYVCPLGPNLRLLGSTFVLSRFLIPDSIFDEGGEEILEVEVFEFLSLGFAPPPHLFGPAFLFPPTPPRPFGGVILLSVPVSLWRIFLSLSQLL